MGASAMLFLPALLKALLAAASPVVLSPASTAGAAGRGDPQPDLSTPDLQFDGFRVRGRGAHLCTVGEHCSFTLHVAPSAWWNVSKTRPLEWDFIITLVGPTLVDVQVAEAPSPLAVNALGHIPGRTFVAAYRSWDAGAYQVTVTNPCFTFRGSRGARPGLFSWDVAELATWQVTVHPKEPVTGSRKISVGQGVESVNSRGSPDRKGWSNVNAGMGGREVPEAQLDVENDDEACVESMQARWVRRTKGAPQVSVVAAADSSPLQPMFNSKHEEYAWQPYPCAKWQSLAGTLRSLLRLNVKEIAFIGDSQLRNVLLHSVFLVTDRVVGALAGAHFDFSVTIHLPEDADSAAKSAGLLVSWRQLSKLPNAKGNQKLLMWETPGWSSRGSEGQAADCSLQPGTMCLSFYWVDGVYFNGQYGCQGRGRYSSRTKTFPKLRGKPDVAVLDGGTWTAHRCKVPLLAYPEHFHGFIRQMQAQLWKLGCLKTVFFGSLPNPTCWLKRSFNPTNPMLAFQNQFSQITAAHYGIPYFNAWEVAAPRYTCTCYSFDFHYSCPNGKLLGESHPTAYQGPVGKALVQTFFAFLSSYAGKASKD